MLSVIGLVASAIVFTTPASMADKPAAPAQPAETQDASAKTSDFQGVIGMCVRWTPDADHVADAVVVNPSTSAALNASTPSVIKSMTWTAPAHYDGKWLGVNLSIGGAATPAARPDCSALAG